MQMAFDFNINVFQASFVRRQTSCPQEPPFQIPDYIFSLHEQARVIAGKHHL